MGGGASSTFITSTGSVSNITNDQIITNVTLKKLPEAIEESLFVHERFCVIIDPTEQASRFLRYQMGTFINSNDPISFNSKSLNRALVSSFQNGRTLTIKFNSLKGLDSGSIFQPNLFPHEILSRSAFYNESVWSSCLDTTMGDPDPSDASIATEFAFIVCTMDDYIPIELSSVMSIIKVIDESKTTNYTSTSSEINTNNTNTNSNKNIDNAVDDEDTALLKQIAALYGVKEVIRNSKHLVEAAFDGDLVELINLYEKGYHLESVDERKHTALSEASCQGHVDIIIYLLQQGCDPNALSDTGRSPLWRAAYNNHFTTVEILLNAGGHPDYRDKISMETAYDVTTNLEIQQLLQSWNCELTSKLIEKRKNNLLLNIEDKIKTHQQRELIAKEKFKYELIQYAECNNVEKIKDILLMILEESEQTNTRPRVTAEVRNSTGQTLLSIASQYNHEELASFLLTYWKEFNPEYRHDDNLFNMSSIYNSNINTNNTNSIDNIINSNSNNNDSSNSSCNIVTSNSERNLFTQIFQANPNARDTKGWSCVAIAVFHNSFCVLKLLLAHGGDPSIRNSYNKSAWDLAEDEVDAAGHTIRSRANLREILLLHSNQTNDIQQQSRLFGINSNTNQNTSFSSSRAAAVNSACNISNNNSNCKSDCKSNSYSINNNKSSSCGGYVTNMYDGLNRDGSAVVMNIEMQTEAVLTTTATVTTTTSLVQNTTVHDTAALKTNITHVKTTAAATSSHKIATCKQQEADKTKNGTRTNRNNNSINQNHNHNDNSNGISSSSSRGTQSKADEKK